MKKIIFGSAAAILAAVGLSAFKSAKTTTTTYYWFSINNHNVGVGEKTRAFTNSGINPVTFANTISSTLSATNDFCSQDDIHQCLVGFTRSRIIEVDSIIYLKTVSIVVGSPSSLSATTVPTGLKYTMD